jgi:hypothetical protein
MALEFFGIAQSQEEIASEIGHLPGVGTPARNITRLSAPGVKVQYNERGTFADLRRSLEAGAVTIVFVRTGELPYWQEDTPHALVIAGIVGEEIVYVNDPAFADAPIAVAPGDFLLAWEEFGNQWAVITQQPPRPIETRETPPPRNPPPASPTPEPPGR